MSKYIKLEDAIRKYAEMIADEAYWEHGVGDGSPDKEDLDIAREYYSDLPTIDIVHCAECKHWNKADHICKEAKRYKPETMADHFCKYGERRDNE